MKKAGVIAISIFIFLIALSIVLFGFVFCVRKQTVSFVSEMSLTEQDVLNTASIKNGKPILLLDKESATNKLEAIYPNLKVVQIKTISLFEIEIVVRERFPLFYIEKDDKYYVLDEELKVLDILETQPTNLINVTNQFNISTDTKKADFVGSELEREITYNLFVSVYTFVVGTEGKQAREDMANIISTVCLESDKLTIKTKEDVTIEILKPNIELGDKINICFSAIEELTPEQKGKTTIKILYNAEGTEYKGYVSIAE